MSGRSSFCPDGASSCPSSRNSTWSVGRSSLGGNSVGLLAGRRDHCGEVQQVQERCTQDPRCLFRRCSAKESPKVATQEAKEGLRKRRGGELDSSPPKSKPCSSARSAGVGHAAHDSKLPDFVSSSSFGAQLFQTVFSSRTPLGNFCRQCLRMKEGCHDLSKQLFPCPIPAKLPAPISELRSGRRRSRFALRVTIREHLRLFVATCNWLVLGRPKQLDVSWPP